jgi:sensor histidine kinase YesM
MKIFFANERSIRFIGILLVSLVSMSIHFDGEVNDPLIVFREFAVAFTFTLTLWEGNRAVIMWLRRRYPRNEQTARRLLVQAALCVAFTMSATFAVIVLFNSIDIPICEPDQWLSEALINLLPMGLIVSIYEGAYFFDEWIKNLQRSETLAKENIRSQFEALKSQLDPHFLFNSLNTLAALIDDENEPAQTYLEQLSDVYRYVLVSQQKETVPLHEELAFVDSYISLNKTRFRDNLIVLNEISEEAMHRPVPPLSIQILVENAIKHNVVSRDKPLTLRLSMDAHGYITVENNVQKKNILEKSTKTGLQNMINRYALLTTKKVEILQTTDVFSVKVPPLTS